MDCLQSTRWRCEVYDLSCHCISISYLRRAWRVHRFWYSNQSLPRPWLNLFIWLALKSLCGSHQQCLLHCPPISSLASIFDCAWWSLDFSHSTLLLPKCFLLLSGVGLSSERLRNQNEDSHLSYFWIWLAPCKALPSHYDDQYWISSNFSGDWWISFSHLTYS